MKRMTQIQKCSLICVISVGVFTFIPSSGEAGLSGDAAIDLQLGTGYRIRAGGRFGGIVRSNATKCNSPGADPQEHHCPNDALYTPAPASGGYQAWGVGVAHIFGEDSELECALIPFVIFDNGIEVYFQTVCYLVPVATPMDNGYEAKIVISDSACQASAMPGRTGGPADKTNNCFYYHNIAQVNDLPSAYRDTTISDPRSVLIIGFGSADAASIDPGTTYLLEQFFRSDAQPVVLGTNAMHLGAVTSEMLAGAACISSGFENNRCYYGVDTASVGGPGNAFSQVVPPTP